MRGWSNPSFTKRPINTGIPSNLMRGSPKSVKFIIMALHVAKSEFAPRKVEVCSEESPKFSREFRGLVGVKSRFTPTKVPLYTAVSKSLSYLRPKSAGTSPHFDVSHLIMGLR